MRSWGGMTQQQFSAAHDRWLEPKEHFEPCDHCDGEGEIDGETCPECLGDRGDYVLE